MENKKSKYLKIGVLGHIDINTPSTISAVSFNKIKLPQDIVVVETSAKTNKSSFLDSLALQQIEIFDLIHKIEVNKKKNKRKNKKK